MSHLRASLTGNRGVWRGRTGQAAVELAVFGSLLLLCLSILVRMGLSFNYRQLLQQESFRKAQALARGGPTRFFADDADYTIIRDLRVPDPTDTAFGVGSRSRVVANSHVLWATDLFGFGPDEKVPQVFEINGKEHMFNQSDFSSDNKDPVAAAAENRKLGLQGDGMTDQVLDQAALTRTEDANGISSGSAYKETETIATFIRTKDNTPPPGALHRGHKFHSVLTTERNVLWQTPHAQ